MNAYQLATVLIRILGLFLAGLAILGGLYALTIYALFFLGADGILDPTLLFYAAQSTVSSPFYLLFGVALLRFSQPLATFITKPLAHAL
ncbi:hypothetical protein [Chitinilyticum piscinae]|uniref:Uncharacterized protein n=1 Tax=Chitinilyticum piscinae TaxID=2866724 RepID=A0A8J7K180_9NEIS|nr:hypothetical protein [Chitinilyticum piscinae]MBE9608272.1 hypothetical protein [Chitinilyticum piscinae]